MLNEKKLLNHEMICDKEIEHLIYLGREAELNMRYWRHHQKIYKKTHAKNEIPHHVRERIRYQYVFWMWIEV